MFGGRSFWSVWHHSRLLMTASRSSMSFVWHTVIKSDCCCLIHLRKRTQGELRLHCRQRHPWRKVDAWHPRAILVQLFYCLLNATTWSSGKSKKFQIQTRKITRIISVHHHETSFVLTAIPELSTCTMWRWWRPCQVIWYHLLHQAGSYVWRARCIINRAEIT